MKLSELFEGGWATDKTFETKITPDVVAASVNKLKIFEISFNKFLKTKELHPIEIGNPAGSATYFKRDLIANPTREYGDIDVHCHIPLIAGLTSNAVATLYKNAVIEFCQNSSKWETSNGTNIITEINNQLVQIDLLYSYITSKEWVSALAPAYNVKGILCASLYSSLAKVLEISISSNGVQVKVDNTTKGVVPFKQNKNTSTVTISNNPQTWALDIAKYLKCTKISSTLKRYPGVQDGEVTINQIVESIKGILESLVISKKIANTESMLNEIISIYKMKINATINSSKYDKAGNNQIAIAKAEKTKKLLIRDSALIIKLLVGK